MNANTQFRDFVKRQQHSPHVDKAVDWGRARDEWLAYLVSLYGSIRTDLAEYVSSDAITLRETSLELNEEGIGSYVAPRLTIAIGKQEIILTPVGTLLIGSKGRVDVEGSSGSSRLILVDRDWIDPGSMIRVGPGHVAATPHLSTKTIEWTWKIVSRPPAMQFVELNRDTLFEMLMAVSNG